MHKKQEISVWFFIGVLLAIYGVLIAGATMTSGISADVKFSEYHVGVWWGALLFVIGAVYSIVFRPRRS
jgi:hypothetical protein